LRRKTTQQTQSSEEKIRNKTFEARGASRGGTRVYVVWAMLPRENDAFRERILIVSEA
jgi:hypothetical protein